MIHCLFPLQLLLWLLSSSRATRTTVAAKVFLSLSFPRMRSCPQSKTAILIGRLVVPACCDQNSGMICTIILIQDAFWLPRTSLVSWVVFVKTHRGVGNQLNANVLIVLLFYTPPPCNLAYVYHCPSPSVPFVMPSSRRQWPFALVSRGFVHGVFVLSYPQE